MQSMDSVALQVPSNTCSRKWEAVVGVLGSWPFEFYGISQSDQSFVHFSGYLELVRRGNIGETPALAVSAVMGISVHTLEGFLKSRPAFLGAIVWRLLTQLLRDGRAALA